MNSPTGELITDKRNQNTDAVFFLWFSLLLNLFWTVFIKN